MKFFIEHEKWEKMIDFFAIQKPADKQTLSTAFETRNAAVNKGCSKARYIGNFA